MIQTLEWTDKGVRFIDQTKLPTEETYVTCKTYDQVADAATWSCAAPQPLASLLLWVSRWE
jgi:methylthioribose-1-phosphate isomerase